MQSTRFMTAYRTSLRYSLRALRRLVVHGGTLALPALALGLGLLGCGEAADSEGSTAALATNQNVRVVQVESQRVEPQRFEDKIALIGVVESPQDAALSAQSTGTILTRSDLGTVVREGEVVARIDAALVEAARDQARANLEAARARAALAEDTFRRQKTLYADSIISPLEYEQLQSDLNSARAGLNQAEAVLKQAEKQYENSFVRAPFTGRVEEVFVEIGEQVMPGTRVARLVDTRNLRIKAGVPERYAADIRTGTEVEVVFKAYGFEPRTGTISFVGSVIDPQNRSFAVEVALSNSDGTLKPEMVADLFVTREVIENQIVVPQTAIIHDETGASVYIVDRDSGTALARRELIQTGPSFGGRTVVTQGLESGEEVIVVGQTNVTDGDAVDTSQTTAVDRSPDEA